MPKTEIYFTQTAKGRRAWRFSRMQFRAFPIGVERAELLIATGEAVDIERNPIHALREQATS